MHLSTYLGLKKDATSTLQALVLKSDVWMCGACIQWTLKVTSERRRFKSRGPQVFLRTFLFRNALAGHHQLVAEDLMEDWTISCISMYIMPVHSGEEADYHQHWKSKNCNL
jgi:hypothetical protein